MSSIELGRSVYGPAVSPYIIGAAVASDLIALGNNIAVPWLHDAFLYSGVTFLVGCVAVAIFEIIAQWRNHQRILDREDAETRLIAPPEAKAVPIAPRVPFPPESFVEFIWKWRDEHGKFPTIQECVDSGINAQLAQYRYQQMVDAGYIVNRIERKSSGEPARTREDFIAAAIADNTLRQQ